MKKLIFLLLYFIAFFNISLFAWDNNTQNSTSDPDIQYVITQTPEPLTYVEKDGKKCVPINFSCPEVKFRKINKDTGVVEKSWNLTYDLKSIDFINYQTGEFSCNYSTNDIIDFSHDFKNIHCEPELKTEKQKLLDGTKILGYNFKKLHSDINAIPEEHTVDLDKIVEDVGIPLTPDEYADKNYVSLSALNGAALTLDTDIIKGTDSRMNLTFNAASSNDTPQAYGDNIQTSEIVPDDNFQESSTEFFGLKTEKSFLQKTFDYIGISADIDDPSQQGVLGKVSDVSDFLDLKNLGLYVELVVVNNEVLYLVLIILGGGGAIYKLSGYSWEGINDYLTSLKANKNDKINLRNYLLALALGGVIFFVPMGNNVFVSDKESEYSSTITQGAIQMLVKEGNQFADLFFYNGQRLILRYLTTSTNTFSKDELNLIKDAVATNLITADREIEFMQKQCIPAYNAYNDTFIKSDSNNYQINPNYQYYNYGIPTIGMCRSTESAMYANLKSVESNTQILESKIESHEKNDGLSKIEKAMSAISYNVLTVSKDSGWNQTALLYTSNDSFNRIGLFITDDKENEIEQATSNYFNKNQIEIAIENEKNWTQITREKLEDTATFGLSFLTDYAVFSLIPNYDNIVKFIQKMIVPKDEIEEKSELSAKIQDYITNFIPSNIMSVGYKIINNGIIEKIQQATPYILSKYVVLYSLEILKSSLVSIFINLKILFYYIDVMLLYFFSPVIFIYVVIISESKMQKVEFAISKFLYLMIYPSMIVFSSMLVSIAENFAKNLLFTTQKITEETISLITSIGQAAQDGVISSFATSFHVIFAQASSSSIYLILFPLIGIYIAFKIIYQGPEMILNLFNAGSAGSDTQNTANELASQVIRNSKLG